MNGGDRHVGIACALAIATLIAMAFAGWLLCRNAPRMDADDPSELTDDEMDRVGTQSKEK